MCGTQGQISGNWAEHFPHQRVCHAAVADRVWETVRLGVLGVGDEMWGAGELLVVRRGDVAVLVQPHRSRYACNDMTTPIGE